MTSLVLALLLSASGQATGRDVTVDLSNRTVQSTGSSTARKLKDRFADVVNVRDYGARGDGVTDDTAAIQAAINVALTFGSGAVVVFPPGKYKVTSTIAVTDGGVALVGQNRLGATSLSAGQSSGPELVGSAESMGDVLLVNKAGTGLYGFQMTGIRISALSTLTAKPNGLHLKDASEFLIDNCYFGQNLIAGIKFNGTNIGMVRGGDFSTNQIAAYFTIDGTSAWTSNSAVWLQHVNMWTSSEAAIKIDRDASSIVVRDSWLEWAPAGLLLTQGGVSASIQGITLDNVNFANGGATPYQDARFVKALAQNTASYSLSVSDLALRNCKSYTSQAGTPSVYAIEMLKNGNSNGSTFYGRIDIDDGIYWGPTTALLYTDMPATVVLRGHVTSKNASFVDVALTAGSGRYSTQLVNSTNGAWSMSNIEASQYGSTAGVSIKDQLAAGDSGTGTVVDSTNTRTNGNLFQVNNNTSQAFRIAYDKTIYQQGALVGANGTFPMRGSIADTSGAVGMKFGNSPALTTTGAKSAAFYSDTFSTEIASIRKAATQWGIRLQSPDGTWYLLTIANGGTVTVTANP